MSKTFIDKACAVVPNLENRISLFHKKLRLAQYAEHSIYDYKLKIAQAALYLQKLPDDFTQDDIEGYLSSLLDQKRYSISFFKHTVFGLQNYYKVMGLKQPRGLVLPKVRKQKKLPRVLSQRSIARLIQDCMTRPCWRLPTTAHSELVKCAGSDGKISVLTDRCSSSAKVRAIRTDMYPSPRRCSLC